MDKIEEIARLWPASGNVVVLTGAGISVASGIPDFRSPGGLWSKYDPMRVATVQALNRTPKEVWRFLLDAARVMGRAKPNPAHEALARLERAGLVRGVVTQNIDGLHQAAGSREVVEFHGSMSTYSCNGCGRPHDAAHVLTLTEFDIPWLCEECGGVVRPDIVFFGESIPLDALEKSGQLAGAAELMLVVGTSCEVAPASSLPYMAARRGAPVVEINRESSRLSSQARVSLEDRAEVALVRLAAKLLGT
ncbi:NAD-dependent protein deacetylase [Fundidesulfovibrio butyratiphilus]